MKTALRILNLEDNETDAELNEAMISARWPQTELVRVDRREDFAKALEEGGYDLILSDYSMPGFDGQSALGMAREKCPNVPFLFVSGTIGEDTAIEALKNGATDYVLKHRLMRLIPAVDRALREVEERTERERAEEAMRQSEHKYRELFECLNDAAFLTEERTGRIIDTNRCAEKLLGCPRTEILGRKQSQFLAMEKARTHDGTLELDAEAAVTFECELVRADKSTIVVGVHATRLKLYGHSLVLRLCHELTEQNPM